MQACRAVDEIGSSPGATVHFIETRLAGVYLVESEPGIDERGSFARIWCEREFAARGLVGRFVQCNTSQSRRRGTLRGLHYQTAPMAEAKLVRCIKGAVFDVVVDVRPGSPTYCQWLGTELDADHPMALYVPEGCAHGFQTLVDEAEVTYPVTQYYAPEYERGVRWDDPAFRIQWPVSDLIISAKDRSWPDFRPGWRVESAWPRESGA